MANREGRGLGFLAMMAAGAAVVLALLVQCAEVASPQTLAPPAITSVDVIVEGASPDLTDWIDAATGCAYLVHRLGGVTPRLNAAGKPLCRGVR
jgi:hypothetical protein